MIEMRNNYFCERILQNFQHGETYYFNESKLNIHSSFNIKTLTL